MSVLCRYGKPDCDSMDGEEADGEAVLTDCGERLYHSELQERGQREIQPYHKTGGRQGFHKPFLRPGQR